MTSNIRFSALLWTEEWMVSGIMRVIGVRPILRALGADARKAVQAHTSGTVLELGHQCRGSQSSN